MHLRIDFYYKHKMVLVNFNVFVYTNIERSRLGFHETCLHTWYFTNNISLQKSVSIMNENFLSSL